MHIIKIRSDYVPQMELLINLAYTNLLDIRSASRKDPIGGLTIIVLNRVVMHGCRSHACRPTHADQTGISE